MTAGRQLVDGVAGARPGSRSQGRAGSGRGGERERPGFADRASFKGLGRWMEDQLDSFMEGDDDWPDPRQDRSAAERRPPASDAWSPPLQEGFPAPNQDSRPPRSRQDPSPRQDSSPRQDPWMPVPAPPAPAPQPRRPLDAISRRAAPLLPPAGSSPRPLPRSSRRRAGGS